MGLDISVEGGDDAFSFRAGSYTGFNDWREWLASIANIELGEMLGFGGYIKWNKDTPFKELLNHSDCDGVLTTRDCNNLKQDFDMFFFKAMSNPPHQSSNGTSISDVDVEWFLNRYCNWHKAVTFVAEGKCRRIRFC